MAFNDQRLQRTGYAFDHLLRYNIACVVSLFEQDRINASVASQLVESLLAVQARGLGGLGIDSSWEDLQPYVERAVRGAVGEQVGGHVGTGRARAESMYCSQHLSLREKLLESLAGVGRLQRTLLALAADHTESVVPYYTCHQRAEPMTLGYYLAAFSEELQGHAERIISCYRRFGLSPAGVGHVVPSPHQLDRKRLAELLGLERVVLHSLYGYYHVDIHIDALGSLALAACTCSRLALDFWLWASSDLRLVTFGPEYCTSSFIMPQKQNPTWLREMRPAAMAVKRRHSDALEIFMHTAPMELGGVEDISAMLRESIDELVVAMTTMSDALRTIEVDVGRAHDLAGQDFTQAVEVAGSLAEHNGVSWREAFNVVKHVIARSSADGRRGLAEVGLHEIEELGAAVLGRPVSIPESAYRESLDVRAIVGRRGDSGPAPEAVERTLNAHNRALTETERFVAKEQRRLAGVWASLEETARSIGL